MPVADSSTTAPANLSPVQAQVIAALAQGRTVTAAAQDAGLHRNTIYNWFHDPAFQTAADEAQREYITTLSDGMRDLAALAVETLRSLLEDPKTPPAVRLRAALAVLQRPHFPNRGSLLPERIEPPREQQVVDGLAMRMTDPMNVRAVGQVPDVPDLPNQPSRSLRPVGCGAASPGKRNLPNSAQGAAA